ncbi:MAG TPA: F0F1 ATP synthase subunit delta [Candidatus Paceibacterota bacterium]|nr:F0F1 ATP synthase subunit delta [Candidatus Paceibacterota bacterium]HMO83052.1 F0F1 ATP synthase subunit delta [Candidatus Paceibacterota bacterium]
MKNTYIKAAFALLKAGQSVDLVLQNMKQVMMKKGHGALYVGVLRGLALKIEQHDFSALPNVVVAKEKDLALGKINALLTELGSATEKFTTTIDPTIVGGVKVSYQHRLVDQSYKTKLKNLYQAIVTKTN